MLNQEEVKPSSLALNMSELEKRLSTIFRPGWYLKTNPDVELAGVDPWDHFLSYGLQERRSPTPLFQPHAFDISTRWGRYRSIGIVEYLTSLHHFLPPSPLFDIEWYLSKATVDLSIESPLEHYIRQGFLEHIDPCPLFVSCSFQQSDHNLTPLEEYLGDPGKWTKSVGYFFSGELYFRSNPDVEEKRINPLLHFYSEGQQNTRYENPVIDSSHALKQLPEARSYSKLVASIRDGVSLMPAQVTDEPISTAILELALESERAKTETWRSLVSPGDHTIQTKEAFLSERAKSIQLPRVTKPKISVIIPTFNDSEMTLECVAAISKSSNVADLEVVVVDDGSNIQITHHLELLTNVNLVRLETNGGYSFAVSKGVENARGEFIFLHNNDAQVLPNALSHLVSTLEREPTIGAVGGLVLTEDLKIQEAGCAIDRKGFGFQFGNGQPYSDGTYRHARDVDYCSAVGLMLRKSTWSEVGGYSEEFRPAYYEDTDLCFKIHDLGLGIRYNPLAVIIHREGSSHGNGTFGGKAFQFRNRRFFAKKWESRLSTHPMIGDSPLKGVEFSRFHNHDQVREVVVFDAKIPDPTEDSGSVRMSEIVGLLSAEGVKIHFASEGSRISEWAKDLLSTDQNVAFHYGNDSLLNALQATRTERPLIWVARPDVFARALATINEIRPKGFVVYDSVDAHILRLQREVDYFRKNAPARLEGAEIALAQMRRLESAAIGAADLTVSVGESDTEFFRQLVPNANLLEISNIHRSNGTTVERVGRSDVLFVGGYQHPPNVHAALFAINQIMPEVWKLLPNVRLVLAGSHPPEELKNHASNRIQIPGWADSLDPFYDRAAVVIAPLPYGAGVKGKVGDAMSRGIPLVASPSAVESMGATVGEEVMVAVSGQEFATSILHLLGEAGLSDWSRLSELSQGFIEREFGTEKASGQISKLLEIYDQECLSE